MTAPSLSHSPAPRRQAILAAAAVALFVAGMGVLSTDLGPWYTHLREPDWKPPDWLFGPAWTLIYAFATLAAVRAWSAGPRRGIDMGAHSLQQVQRVQRDGLMAAFAMNATLNVVWSLLFFRMRRPDWALVEVGGLWLSIVLLVVLAGRRDAVAGWLLVPYLAWVSLAAALNAAVVRLNAPFDGT